MPAVCASVLDGTKISVSSRALRIDESNAQRDVLNLVVADPDRERLASVHTATSEDGKRHDVAIDDDIGLHLEFGRRFVFFYLRSEAAVASVSAPRRSMTEVLMGAASQSRLPAKPRTGVNGSCTALDKLQGDIIDMLHSQKLRFPADLCDSDGTYIVRSLARALWSIDGNHATLQSAVKHNGVPPLSRVFEDFDGYNNWRAKKLKKPQLSADRLKDYGNILLGMLGKPVLRSAAFKEFKLHVEGLAETLLQYSNYLAKAAVESASRRSMDHVVRPLSEFSNLEIRPAEDDGENGSSQEANLQSLLESAGDWKFVEFNSTAVLGDACTVHLRYKFMNSFRLKFPVLVYTYAVGGNVDNIVFMSKIPGGLSQSECLTKSNSIVEELKPKLPQFHTRHIR